MTPIPDTQLESIEILYDEMNLTLSEKKIFHGQHNPCPLKWCE